MKVSEVAKRLRVHGDTIRLALRAGAIKGTKVKSFGGHGALRWDITEEQLQEYLKNDISR